MTEETTDESVQPVETPTEAPAQSLDDIASEFSVEEQASQFQAQPPAQYQPQPAYQPQEPAQPMIPDPISDPTGYDSYMRNQAQSNQGVQDAVSQIQKDIQEYKDETAQARLDADVERAVTKINEKLNVEPLMAEIALEKMYRSDASFKRIWDNRAQNPAAFNKALEAVGDKLAPTFAVRQDPQLTENQRAAQTSQRTMQTTQEQSKDDKWSGLSSNEFSRMWSQEKNG